ncbi:hypothetical protein EAM_P219 (plasmid) [Erwinia amylovora ATCC 49946]|nr:hypothetical protein EAM_P219 [Erwinia amylovora ATCC 49946]
MPLNFPALSDPSGAFPTTIRDRSILMQDDVPG